MNKSVIMIGMTFGAIIGGYLPMLFGAGAFSLSSVFCSFLGGVLGIWLSFKLVS